MLPIRCLENLGTQLRRDWEGFQDKLARDVPEDATTSFDISFKSCETTFNEARCLEFLQDRFRIWKADGDVSALDSSACRCVGCEWDISQIFTMDANEDYFSILYASRWTSQ